MKKQPYLIQQTSSNTQEYIVYVNMHFYTRSVLKKNKTKKLFSANPHIRSPGQQLHRCTASPCGKLQKLYTSVLHWWSCLIANTKVIAAQLSTCQQAKRHSHVKNIHYHPISQTRQRDWTLILVENCGKNHSSTKAALNVIKHCRWKVVSLTESVVEHMARWSSISRLEETYL